MTERKVWTDKEDNALKDIILNKKISKWSAISKIMEKQYGIPGRTGKQCRERWHNQLDSNINKSEWTNHEEQVLFRTHDIYGNRWAKIAHHLEGRTDNAIKNHFYSTLRKSVRRLNRFVSESKFKGQMKEIKPIMLSKVISVAEDKFEKRLKVSNDLIEDCIDIKHRLIKYAKDMMVTAEKEELMRRLVLDILRFHKKYKRNRSNEENICAEESEHESMPAESSDNFVSSAGQVSSEPKKEKIKYSGESSENSKKSHNSYLNPHSSNNPNTTLGLESPTGEKPYTYEDENDKNNALAPGLRTVQNSTSPHNFSKQFVQHNQKCSEASTIGRVEAATKLKQTDKEYSALQEARAKFRTQSQQSMGGHYLRGFSEEQFDLGSPPRIDGLQLPCGYIHNLDYLEARAMTDNMMDPMDHGAGNQDLGHLRTGPDSMPCLNNNTNGQTQYRM